MRIVKGSSQKYHQLKHLQLEQPKLCSKSKKTLLDKHIAIEVKIQLGTRTDKQTIRPAMFTSFAKRAGKNIISK